MTETEGCVWLQLAFGPGSPLPRRIMEEYRSADAFYSAGGTEWRLSGLFSAKQLSRLEQTAPEDAIRLTERCKHQGYGVIALTDPAYPACLRTLHAPPAVLYVHGQLPPVDRELAIAMVGTRDASPYGLSVSGQLAQELVRRGAIVVSGGALGVDTAAHRGALLAGGRTVAVLGCGFNVPYLMSNASLRAQIAQTGALVSEYPPDAPVRAGCFPMRNRLIAGLSRGTVVVEAGDHSGALITAQQALEQGRDVFAVPGSILSAGSAGINRLLREGAKPVACAQDILEEYGCPPPEAVPVGQKAAQKAEDPARAKHSPDPIRKGVDSRDMTCNGAGTGLAEACGAVPPDDAAVWMADLSDPAARLFRALTGQPRPIDELAQRAGLSAREALAAVTELEMLGQIGAHPGKQFALK